MSNWISPKSRSRPEPAGLEAKLMWLAEFGHPVLRHSVYFKGWQASIDMKTTVTGSSCEVKSEPGHPDPTSAVAELINRIRQVVRA